MALALPCSRAKHVCSLFVACDTTKGKHVVSRPTVFMQSVSSHWDAYNGKLNGIKWSGKSESKGLKSACGFPVHMWF